MRYKVLLYNEDGASIGTLEPAASHVLDCWLLFVSVPWLAYADIFDTEEAVFVACGTRTGRDTFMARFQHGYGMGGKYVD